jgi:phosphoribosylglycinamide formyltransferase-1
MSSPLRLAVLGSTRGSTLEGLLGRRQEWESSTDLRAVLSNRPQTGIGAKATAAGIPFHFVDPQNLSREAYDRLLDERLNGLGIDCILLLGYMRILSPALVRPWRNRIANIHPSLLPRHAGLIDRAVHQAVLDAGDTETGCTLHLVDEGVDTGPVLLQERIPVPEGTSVDQLRGLVQKAEARVLVEFLKHPRQYLPST